MPDRIEGLTLQIAVGVAVGIIVAGVTLYLLWLLHMRLVVDEAVRSLWGGTRQVAPVLAAPASPPVIPPVSPDCRVGEAQGQLNGRVVCVGRSSGVVRELDR